jgi:hypothetical protein
MNSSRKRPDTGAVRLNDDWAGIFIRGDECMNWADALRHRGFSILAKLFDSCVEENRGELDCPKYYSEE